MDKFKLNYEQWVSIGKGALIAAVGAGLTYLSQNLTASDFGVYGPVVVAGFSVLANYVRKVLLLPDAPQ